MHTPSASATGARSAHRRSTGSETSIRRVLADIEWWRVADGQREVVPEQDPDEDDRDQAQDDDHVVPTQVAPVPAPLGAGDDRGAERPVTPAPWALQGLSALEVPVAEMAALAIAPATPRRHGHSLESSTSSLESTPESSHVQAEHPFLDLDALDFGLHIAAAPPPALRRTRSESSSASLLGLSRAQSFADFASCERQYADFAFSPLSSPPIFSN